MGSGWKAQAQTSQALTANRRKNQTTNRLPGSAASSKLGRGRAKTKEAGQQHQRSADTVARLKMYKDKAIRNKDGKIVAGAFMMRDQAGDRPMDATTGRIQPDRRWFGNTRVVGAVELDRFREEMTDKVADPYSVVLKRKKLPMGLLQEATVQATSQKAALLEQEPFSQAFGNKSRRKRVKLDQLMIARSVDDMNKKPAAAVEGEAEPVDRAANEDDESGYLALMATANQSADTYKEINAADGIVPWGRDTNLTPTEGEGVDWRVERSEDVFSKGQSKRIWGEFFKVVDCSDVVLHVIDARDVPGTRCTMIERHIAKNAPHKHLVYVLNKIDLVPNWVAKRWMGELAKDRPTVAFHASLTHAFGKGALISLLRQFGKLHEDKKQIAVGIIGYPNVGKSSIINTLTSKKSVKVAPVPGETKIWQYVTLFRRISLIDCPGVVVDSAGDTECDSVLKGVIRSERLETPEDFIAPLILMVKREHLAAQYKLPKDGPDTWKDANELMEMIAKRCGRLRKGGDPDLRSAAVMLINDYQRGRLPHYVAPPELKEDDLIEDTNAGNMKNNVRVEQDVDADLDAIGNLETNEDEDDAEEAENPEEEDTTEDMKKASKNGASSEVEDGLAPEELIGEGEWDE
jgi:nuclear GTP-binding protein